MNLIFLIAVVSNLVFGLIAAPAVNYVLHEERDGIPQGWSQHERLSPNALLSMRIAMAQRNLDKVEDFLVEVSHPESEKYGQHWSTKDIAETFAPSHRSVHIISSWLKSTGIAVEGISRSRSLGWLGFNATVDQAESLLKTRYYSYKHSSGKSHVGCLSYHIPEKLRAHVDFITPSVHFDVKLPQPTKNNEKIYKRINPRDTVGVEDVDSLPKKGANVNTGDDLGDLGNCDELITPNCLRGLYRIPFGKTANAGNSFGIVEYTPQAYLQSDLDLFFSNFSRNQVQKSPILKSIDGGIVQSVNISSQYNRESDLDLEYGMALVNPQKTTLYQVGDTTWGASFNDFLDALDASFCSSEGEDDPGDDPETDSGHQGSRNCGGFAATKVISTSYSYNEAELTVKYEMRQCNEYLKLGLAGITVLYASGDYGVAGRRGTCINSTNTMLNNSSDSLFNPSFPATCPYVTAIGATQIKQNAPINAPEVACETQIRSGGGFSNVFSLPSYQASAVQSWFKNHPPPYGAGRFNNSQTTRGFPDISANGANYAVAVDGKFSHVYGTSASTPVVGAIFTLINEARINAGKSSIGFVNPFLYENADALSDITSGGNAGCGTPGFEAVEGWDPVTGLGTPDYEKLLTRFLALP